MADHILKTNWVSRLIGPEDHVQVSDPSLGYDCRTCGFSTVCSIWLISSTVLQSVRSEIYHPWVIEYWSFLVQNMGYPWISYYYSSREGWMDPW
jgi:hypothetical protein